MVHQVGIIGLGTVGSRFVEQFNKHSAFDLVAAWDANPETCSLHRDSVHICSGADEVIAASDLVYIAVPPKHHHDYVLNCIAGDTAIFCEKPLGIDLVLSRELVNAVKQSGLPAGVNFVFSAAPAARELQHKIATGELGKLTRVDLRLHFSSWPRVWHEKAQWLRLRDQGGWIREVVSHFIFLVSRLLGPIRMESGDVYFEDGPDGILCEQIALARFTSSSVPVTLAGTSHGAGPDVVDLTIQGTSTSARIWDWYQLQQIAGARWVDLFESEREVLGGEAYTAQLDQLDRMMKGQNHTIATFAEALSVQECVEELLTS
jgi:predicted dehydrogenase